MDIDMLEYYSKPGEITKLERYQSFIDWITASPKAICQVVQGLIVHDMWCDMYGIEFNPARVYPQKVAYMEDIIEKALEIDSSNLAIPRHPKDRVIACCREFATLMCAMLRAKGIPARSRCGFATYFGWDGSYEDHWICEYWDGKQWIMCDPQLDPLQQSFVLQWGHNVDSNQEKNERMGQFDPQELKPGEFVTAGQAWKLCRQQGVDPEKFGIGCTIRPEWGIDSLHGLWFVRGQLLRDLASLNKVETVPYLVRICKQLDWKPWTLVDAKDHEVAEGELDLLDEIAELTGNIDQNFNRIRELYQSNQSLMVPAEMIAR